MTTDIGTSMTDVRVSNRAAVLKMLYTYGALSRKELAQLLNLTPATISNITADLIAEQVVLEGTVKEYFSRSGRKEVPLSIDLKRFRVICAYIASRTVEVFCMDLDGELFYKNEMAFSELVSGEAILEAVCDDMQVYMDALGQEERGRIIGAGFAIKGIVDPVNGVSIRSFGLWEDNLPVREILESRLDIRVVMNNNVRCVAYAAKLLHSNNGMHSMLFVKYGPLIGGALIMQDELYCGQSYQAMEVGHTVVDMNGSMCRCGKRGCLETVIGFDVMGKLLELQYSPVRVPVLYELTGGDKIKIDMETILCSYDRGDPVVSAMVNRSIDYLSVVLVNEICTINPEKVVLYGRPFESEAFTARLMETMEIAGAGSYSTSVSKSEHNLQLDRFGCVSIVIKDFLDSGASLR